MADETAPPPSIDSVPSPATTDPSVASAIEAAKEANEAEVTNTGTSTPALQLPAEAIEHSLRVSLADMCAKATALYAQKKYEDAVELYSAAAEMQSEMHGDMNPQNADILFLYGRALFKVGQEKSDVLGGKAPDAKKQKKKAAKVVASARAKAMTSETVATDAKEHKEEDATTSETVAVNSKKDHEEDATTSETVATDSLKDQEEDLVENGKEQAAAVAENKVEAEGVPSKPMFSFEGDENIDELDEEEDVGEDEGDEAEDDELAIAFEILDLARVLFQKRLAEETEGNEVDVRHIKERLADAYDLLAEISLENERYLNAIDDFRQSLKLKEGLFPPESEVLAEAHYKLSLALEFASVTSEGRANEEDKGEVREDLRQEAAKSLEAAMYSTNLKLQAKKVDLAAVRSPEENTASHEAIHEISSILAEMKQRLDELKKPPIDVKAAVDKVMGSSTGSTSKAEQEAATKNAKDLTGLVRKKRKPEDEEEAPDPPKKAKTEECAAE